MPKPCEMPGGGSSEWNYDGVLTVLVSGSGPIKKTLNSSWWTDAQQILVFVEA